MVRIMKKKREKATAATSASTAAVDEEEASPYVYPKSLIHQHTLFFDKLIELIPSKFYLPNDDAESKPWFQGLSKAAKASAKLQTRENIKKARRDRLDPDKSNTSTLDLLKQSIKNDRTTKNPTLASDEDDNEKLDAKPAINFDGNPSVTYEELRQKLHRKIELLRGNRGSGGEKPKSEKKEKEKKRKRNELEKKSDNDDGLDGNLRENAGEIEKEVDEATKGIEFGKVKIGGEEGGENRKKKRKKMSKLKELERAKRLAEVRKDNPVFSEKQSWKAATSKAMGVKVHDNPKLLKESIKKDKKRREKNANKWKERVETTEKMKGEKQHKRAENIADRIHQKKMRKIAKREKKLMRPGFEGRKEGHITEE